MSGGVRKKIQKKYYFIQIFFHKNRHISGASHWIATGVEFLDSDGLSMSEIDLRQFLKSLDPLAFSVIGNADLDAGW